MKILHLEDNDNDAELICEALRREVPDTCVTRVATPGAFAGAMDRDDWDIILADYSLPGFDGISALKLAVEKHPGLPFIFVTGALGEERAVETLRNGATDYIMKQRLDRLPGAVGRAIRESRTANAKKRAEHSLATSLHEKELLLQEVHHRVNNNLQIICSLLNMQSNAVSDPSLASALQESQRRVQSMAMIHAMLYASSSLKDIDFAAYAKRLAVEISNAYGRDESRIELIFDLEPMYFDIERAIPCGLILNELVSNAFKYAFPQGRSGEIRVTLKHQGSSVRMAVEDTGVGLPQVRAAGERKSLGLSIVQTLAYQLRGAMEVTSDKGSHFVLTLGPCEKRHWQNGCS